MADTFIVIFCLIHRRGSFFCPPFMSRSAFQVRLKLHLSVLTPVRFFWLIPQMASQKIDSRRESSWLELIFPLCSAPPPFPNHLFPSISGNLKYWPWWIQNISIKNKSSEIKFSDFYLWSAECLCALTWLWKLPQCQKSHTNKSCTWADLALFAQGKKLSFLSNPGHTWKMPEGVHCREGSRLK